jgi:methylisocitrate lyase
MVQRIRAAVSARRDSDFLVIARTDARAVEGFDAAVARARAYIEAGADVIFPEALLDLAEFKACRSAISVPMLANMTEFGKSELFSTRQLADAGVGIVIYPVTTLRLAMGAVEEGLGVLRDSGTNAGLVNRMQSRQRLYDLLGYEDYNVFDSNIYNFSLDAPGEKKK